MSSNNRQRGAKGALFIAVAVAVAAKIAIILFSGFSIGGSMEANPFGPGEDPPAIVMTARGEEYRENFSAIPVKSGR